MEKNKICPLCGNDYTGYPALSRVLNEDICSDCGVREALIPQTKQGFIDLWSTARRLPKNALQEIAEKLKDR